MKKSFLDEPGALWTGLFAYILWGLFPIYWKMLKTVPAWEILGHRVVWSLIFLAAVISSQGRWRKTLKALRDRWTRRRLFVSSLFIGFNGFLYIWAVNAGFVLETSLGYFISPLLGMLLGVIVLGERMFLTQKIAIGMIIAAVAWLALQYGRMPWIALSLAVSFSFYTLARKRIDVGAIDGLFLELLFLLPPALIYLGWLELNGRGAFLHAPAQINGLLLLSGVATATPLVLFASAVRKLDLTVIGVIQYLSPSCQFLLAIFLYHEPLGIGRLAVFVVIWTAVALYLGAGIRNAGHERRRIKKEELVEEMPI